MRRNNKDYLLALCEGNKCKCGKKGRKPGGGRVQLFEKKKKRWRHSRTIALPDSLPFVDYSGMSVDNGRVAIVSQVNSMLWVGQFDEAGLDVARRRATLRVSATDDGAIRYGNIEGVGWISSSTHRDGVGQAQEKEQPDKGPSKKISRFTFSKFSHRRHEGALAEQEWRPLCRRA